MIRAGPYCLWGFVMLQLLTTWFAVAAMTLHALAGCCWHHVHAASTCCPQDGHQGQASASEQLASLPIAARHSGCCRHASAAAEQAPGNSDAPGDDHESGESPADSPTSIPECRAATCVYVTPDRVQWISPLTVPAADPLLPLATELASVLLPFGLAADAASFETLDSTVPFEHLSQVWII